ncbi:MAG TPA: CoA pyrophosphatase [Dehalococcoidia bacterium]|nr:CoA pyrophosphatase [Dehalococcoidia bacterium]
MNQPFVEGVIEQARQVLERYHPSRIEDQSLVAAAVLMLMYEKAGEPYVLLIERTELVQHHKGQIAFPGGSCEECDLDARETALREAFEELGLQPGDVEIIGQLDDVVTGSHFRVTPVVGVLKQAPYPFLLEEREVASILEVPLAHFQDERNFEMELRQRSNGQPVLMPAFNWNGYHIWGATARILRQFLNLLNGHDGA